ncbi:MAG TPA: DUF305 domain-containing protein [Sphingomicrobium sp.]|nr:DUF305 domain-containing protein [Sphingomicrobium sp.]
MIHKRTATSILRATVFAGLAAASAAAGAQTAPIIQPGAPGQPARPLSAQEASRIANTRFSEADVKFMQDMIHHHHQAVMMSSLVKDRTNRQAVVDAARRIDASQEDEIKFMQGWLRDRGQAALDPAAHAGHAMPAAHGAHASMPGMATPQQMAALAAAKGPQFDRLFLERMIAHHAGAVEMARDLLDTSGAAYDPTLYEFANEVINEQEAEIEKMSVVLAGLGDDRRSTLKPGFRNAGEAIRNMRLLASLPKPAGFFDPANPSGEPPKTKGRNGKPEVLNRAPLLSFANTDMAFSGDLLAVGNYHGFNIYRLTAAPQPTLISSVICPGGQGDLSIVGNILIMSVEQTRGRLDCGRQGVSEDVSPERFRGIRIFDISNPVLPRQVGAVQTCRGSHTHSVVSGPGRDGRIIVYNSGTAGVRSERELPGCVGEVPGDPRTSLFRIDVIEIPVANPAAARIIDSPAVFADPRTGNVAGLWRGGTHGEGTQETERTDQCHDITTFPTGSLAAGACSGNGIIFDISNPRQPRRIDAVMDPNFAYWHSATFNNDGTKVLFTDEWGGGGMPRCRAQDPRTWGANAIYDIVDGKLRFRSHYKLPAPQTEEENCVAHNGSIVPVPGRDIFVQSWYQGGISVLDFTDSANPREIAYFDRGPISGERMAMGGFWSSYWYKGRIYGTEIARGLDVFALTPSEDLTANEIAAASIANYGERFNPQQQLPVTWPAHPVVALAYLDQLQRQGVAGPQVAALRQALTQARTTLDAGRRDGRLASQIASLGGSFSAAGGDARRVAALRQTLNGIAGRLR